MKIFVTQDDIDKGEIEDCKKCPVARAMSRAFGREIRVGTVRYWEPGLVEFAQPLPLEVQQWIRNFDRKINIPKPFNFDA